MQYALPHPDTSCLKPDQKVGVCSLSTWSMQTRLGESCRGQTFMRWLALSRCTEALPTKSVCHVSLPPPHCVLVRSPSFRLLLDSSIPFLSPPAHLSFLACATMPDFELRLLPSQLGTCPRSLPSPSCSGGRTAALPRRRAPTLRTRIVESSR
eukprot:3837198-Rhodomonas_salina.1